MSFSLIYREERRPPLPVASTPSQCVRPGQDVRISISADTAALEDESICFKNHNKRR